MSLLTTERPAWSKSRNALLKECRRKLVFSTLAEPGTEARRLKRLKGRHLWSGGLVHEVVGNFLKTVRQAGELPSEEDCLAGVKERMRNEFRASKSGAADGPRLFEHEYGTVVEADVWRGHWENVEKSLRWFFRSRWLERLKAVGPESWKAVDELLDFDVNGIKAYVKIDCAIETGGRFFLIDWKTSALKPDDTDGLDVAALYAHEVWGAEPGQIEAVCVSLLDGRANKAEVSEDTMMATHLKIEEEASRLAEALQTAGENPLAIAFPQNTSVCRWCNFHKLCYPQ